MAVDNLSHLTIGNRNFLVVDDRNPVLDENLGFLTVDNLNLTFDNRKHSQLTIEIFEKLSRYKVFQQRIPHFSPRSSDLTNEAKISCLYIFKPCSRASDRSSLTMR